MDERSNLHLEETEAARVEAVLPFPLLQRQKLYQLVNEVRVREVLKDDLLTLIDTQVNATTKRHREIFVLLCACVYVCGAASAHTSLISSYGRSSCGFSEDA